MGEFDEFTKKLSDEHAQKTDEHLAKQRAEREARNARYEIGREAIEKEAMPLLKEATDACKNQGFRVESEQNWLGGFYTTPTVTFQVFGPKKRPHDESSYEVSGHKVGIAHDGGEFSARVSNSSIHSKIDRTYSGTGIDAVRNVIKLAISSLYEAISPDTI